MYIYSDVSIVIAFLLQSCPALHDGRRLHPHLSHVYGCNNNTVPDSAILHREIRLRTSPYGLPYQAMKRIGNRLSDGFLHIRPNESNQ